MAKKDTSPLAMGRMQRGSIANKKKKKDEEEKKAVVQKRPQSSSVSKPTQQQRQNQKSYGTTQPRVTQKQPTPRARTSTQQRSVDPKEARRQESARNMRTAATRFASEDRRTAAQAQKMNMPTAEEQRRSRENMRAAGKAIGNTVRESLTDESKARMQRQKSGIQTEEDKLYNEQRNQKRIEVAKNTGRAAKKGVEDTLTGYGKTLADIDEMAKSSDKWTEAKSMKLGIDKDDTAGRAKVEEERQKSIKEARRLRLALGEKQEKRQQEFDEATKNATGLEKAWYGAVESGTGMATDMAVGAVTGTGQVGALASMGIRSYGTTRGQAEKEGATENEDRLYSLLQAGKEVGTEMMFQGAGLAKSAFSGGKVGLSLADRAANALTKGLTGKKADVVGAGVRLLGGTAEENAEEFAGWLADPLIKELTYGRNVRERMKESLLSNIPQVNSREEADRVASYFSTSKFTDDLVKDYTESGMSKEQAAELAEEIRDMYAAYYAGDQETLDSLSEDLAGKLSGQAGLSRQSWSLGELADTFASTTLLTLTTGIPAAASTSIKGNQIFDSPEIKEQFGENAAKKVADIVKSSSDAKLSVKADAMAQRLESGKDITGTQKYDLIQGLEQRVKESAKRAQASEGAIREEAEAQDLVPTYGLDRNGNRVFAPETEKAFNAKYAQTELTVEAVKNYMESDSSISDDEARRSDAVKKAISDLHVGALTVGDVLEFGYGNELAREALKAEEGIDLNDYIVRNSDGSIDYAATSEATEDALFKINAQNAIEAARVETEVYIDRAKGNIDRDIMSRMSSNGQSVWKSINQDLDPRNISDYLTKADSVEFFYQAGRNTDVDMNTFVTENANSGVYKNIDTNMLKRAFAAGARDRIILNTPGYGQTVKAGSNIPLKNTTPILTGQLFVDPDVELTDTKQAAYLALAMSTNTNIHIKATLKSKAGVEVNGQSQGNDIYLNVNAGAEKNLGYVFMHEMTHQIKQYAPNEYMALENLVREKWFNKDANGMKRHLKSIIDLYSVKGGQTLSEEDAMEEIIADAMAEAIDDPNFAAEVCEQDLALGQAILNSIKEALRSIRAMFTGDNMRNEAFHKGLLSYLGILDEAEKMWINALATARKNKAAGLIADWQDRANGEARYSITPEQDAEYMSAVESGDMETAQRMVDEAAARSMPRTKLTGRWYHGTENEFTEFNFSQGGKNGHADGYGIYLTNDPEVASSYGSRMIEGYVNVERPASALTTATLTKSELHRLIKRTVDNEAETLQSEGYDSVDQAKFDTWISNYTDTYHAGNIDKAIDEVIDAITNINGNDYDIVLEIMTGMGIRNYEEASAFYDILTEETGIDGFETKWGDESEMADPNTPTIALAFRSEQIKDAAPVTYDDNGNVIPLSERFNLNNPDIRYSFTTDKDDYIKGGQIPKELRQWAKDIGLDSISKQPTRGPVIVSVKDLRSAWMQKNGRNDEAEVINEVLDTIGRSLTNTIGKYNYIDLSNSVNATVHYRTNKDGKPTSVILSCQVQNAEYEVNFDFTTICSKRKAMQKVLERFIKTEGEHKSTLYDELKLDEEGMYKLRLILEKAGFEVSCKGCFVEQNRYSQQKQAKTIADDWNKALDEWAKENGTEVTDNFDLVNLDINSLDYDEINEAFARYSELIKTKPKKDVATKNRTLIEAHPFFRKRMNPSDYASVDGQRALMAIGSTGGTNLYGLLKRGQSDSKQSVPFTAYNGEVSLLPDNMKGKTLYDYLMSIGGARAQSASDFQIENFYDYMQLVADLSARGLPMHMYTKVIECAELFGMTGIKINLSAMCDVDESLDGEYAGLKLVDGKYEYNISDQSIDYPKAVELQKKPGYSKNIGIIMVTLSKQHMLKSLDDNDVRYIIGYHSSAMPVVVAQMTNMGNATDYTKINKTNKLNEKGRALFAKAMEQAEGETDLAKYKDALRIFDDMIQEEVAADKRKVPRRGNEYARYMSAYGSNTADFNTYEDLSKSGDARKTADNYIEWCMNNDLIPIYFPFAFHDNYYKCEIYDFNMYDNVDGNYAPMGPVQNIYPGLDMTKGETDTTKFMGRVTEMMDEQNTINEALDSQYDNVFDEAKNELRFSITGDEYIDFDEADIDRTQLTPRADAMKTEEQMRDEAYMDAVNSGNMEEAQRLVEDAAKKAGYGTRLYHGTRDFGFTQIQTTDLESRSDGGFYEWSPFFASDSLEVAQTYSSQDEIKRISEASEPFDEDRFDDEYNDAVNSLVNAINEFAGIYNYMDYSVNPFIAAYKELQTTSHPVKDITEDLIDNVSDIISELAWSRAVDYVEAHPEENISEDEYADELQESIETNSIWVNIDIVNDMLRSYDEGMYGNASSGNYELLANTDNLMQIDAKGNRWNTIPANALTEVTGEEQYMLDYVNTRTAAAYARDHGYDGIKISNLFDDGGHGKGKRQKNPATIYIFFKPESQVKSADTVTYADDGSVIPLSQRFDPTNNDIRYSLPTQDADGKVLTDGQMEYFKNSQARNEQGRLVPVYHGTFRGPRITVFNESSDGIWFTSDRSIAEDYSMGYEMGIPGAMYGDVRNPYDSDDEYFAKKGIRIEQNSNGDWVAAINRNGRDHYWGAAETKEELIDSLYESNENEELFDSQFTLRDVYPVYLNLENPKIIECNGSMHDDVNGTRMTTRELAAEAMAEGYDGIIFRNIVDPFEPMDVYVAFSSNQIKDINNENPTENPDIRYSITPEDEGMSKLAYEDAMDDSYEALARYEEMLDDPNAEQYFSRPFKEEDVAKFFDSLRAEDAVPSADPSFEEDRVRRAKSKAEFYNSVNAKWNDRWTTEGEVLDLKSVKKDIKNLVMGVMANSDTDAQYRNKLVRQTLLDVRTAYQLMKQDRTDVASYLLFHSAQRMIEGVEFIQDDTAFQEYKEIRDYLRTYRINAPQEFWENESFLEFRKEYYGRLRIGKGNSNIEDVYKDLEDRWPHLFNEEQRHKADLKDKPWDLLQHIGVVVDSNVTPFMEAYSSEEAMSVITETADALYDIMAGGKEVVSLADSYKKRFDEKTKAMKQRHAEAILRERKIREEGIQKERQKFREFKEKRKERTAHKTYFDRIVKTHKALVDRLVSNTADKNIPEQYKRELAKLLAAFDLQTVGSKEREAKTGRKAKNTIKLGAIRDTLHKIEDRTQLFHVSDAITDIMDGLSDIEGKTIDELSASELSNIDKMLRSLLHEFNTYRNVKAGAKKRQAADIGAAQVESDLAHAKKYGRGNDYQGFLGALDKLVNMDEMTPAYLFKRIDPNKQGLGLMYGEIRKSLDTYIRNQNQLNGWMEEIVGKYHQKGILWNKYGSGELANWRSTNYKQTFNLTNGTVELTPAQMMSLYCLSRRNQAYRHMIGAGIVVAPVSFQAKIMSDIKERANMSLPVILTDADIQTICAALTPEQVNVANQLQELMSTKMADWGNDASMRVLGIKLFNETDYFPIKSDKAALQKDLNDQEFVEAIRNFGFTKAVQPGARNAIMVEDIFDVVAEHCNNMNLYNAYSESINDFMKVYNYRHFMEDGSEYTVQQSVAHAYSRKATTFIMTFMRDLNGNVSGRDSGIESMMQTALGNAKKAAVFANGRVALQQPTAITRAFAVIDPKYLKGVKPEKGAMQEMFEHCPIALWKSWGYYDINMGRSIEDIMMNNGSWAEDKMTDLYGKLDNVTWAAIWQMVKAEMKDTHPNVEIGSDEYFELCNERMTEIVDLTQVVDSPLHRSHGMRDKSFFMKLSTSFMAEPTLTFNMIKDGYVRSYEAFKAGDKAQAAKIFGRTSSVALIQAAAVASCAAIWDALRGKNPGDDDDDEELSKFRLWWLNTIENFKDETLKPWNKIYIVKDIASIFEGWDNKNLAFQGYQTLYQGLTQMQKKLTKGSKTSWWTINSNIIGGFGYLIGVPFKTVMKDSMSIYKMLGFKSEFVEKMLSEEKTEAVLEIGDGIKPEGLTGKLADFFKEDEEPETTAESAEYSDEDLPDNLSEEQKEEIRKAGERRTKKGVKTSEAADRDKNTMLYEAEKAAAGYEGSERDKKIWSSVSQGYKSHIESGDFAYIARMRAVVKQAGGDLDYFDEQINKATKTALKKTIEPGGADTEAEMVAQQNMRYYLQAHGVTQEEISADICYKSDAAKDLKVAFRLNDEQAIIESSYALMWAGITQTDIDRLYKNRNRMDLTKYDGKYKDRLKSTGNFIWPTEGVITSHFGYRNAPTAGASSNHPAIDIGAPQGTAVVAADGGTVIYAGRNSGYGNSVGIKHDNGMVTYYNHLYSWNVNVGDTVGQGQQIAQVGSTGISTGPHLDFKILDTNGEPVDPEQYLQKRQ